MSGHPLYNGHSLWSHSIELVLMKPLIWGHPSIMAKIFGPNGGHYSRVPLLLKNWGHGQLVDLQDMQSARKGRILYTRWHYRKFGPRAHSSWHVLYTNYDPKVSGRVGSSYSSTKFVAISFLPEFCREIGQCAWASFDFGPFLGRGS